MKTATVKACNASSTWTERELFFAAYRMNILTVKGTNVCCSEMKTICHPPKKKILKDFDTLEDLEMVMRTQCPRCGRVRLQPVE